MSEFTSTIMGMDAVGVASHLALVALLGIGAYALVWFIQSICDLYNTFAEQQEDEE